MRVWVGRSTVNVKGVEQLDFELRGPDQSDKLIYPEASLDFVGFTQQDRIPLFAVWGPELGVYSKDTETISFFGKLDSIGMAILFSLQPRSRHRVRGKVIDHLVIYTSEKNVYARPLVLKIMEQMSNSPAPSPASNPSTPSAQSTPARVPTPTPSEASSSTEAYDWGKLVHKITKSTMKQKGISRDNSQYKDIYKMCIQAADMTKRNNPDNLQPSVIQAKIEALLSILN